MSKVPPTASTTPPQRSWPNATRRAAMNVSAVPMTVTWFGVTGRRASADINLSACRRTHASNRVVNIHHLTAAFEGPAGLLVDLDHLLGHRLPRVPPRLLLSGPAHAPADRKSTRLNSSHSQISYAVFCLK